MFLDDVIRYCLPLIFVGMKYTDYEAYTFKFTKDAEMEIDSDLRTGVLQKISKGVKSRKRGEPIRFVYDEQIPKDLLKRLVDRLNVDKNDTGVLAVGKKADIIAIDLSKPHLYPNFDTPALLTCSAQAGDVCMTMVDGNILYENGEFKTLDENKVRADMERAVERLYRK